MPGHQDPVSCLAPSPGHGCAPVAGGVIPQCVWANVSAAKHYCGEWEQCEGFHCQRVAKTSPSGCGDCPQPAGSWCKCTIQTTCRARGTGTKLSGGGSGDATDYAYIKAGNLTGWLLLPHKAIKNGSIEPQKASHSTVLGHITAPGCHLKPGAPRPYKALCKAQTSKSACMQLNETCAWTATPVPPAPPVPAAARSFVFDFTTGRIVFDTSGEAWNHSLNPVAPLPTCKLEGCISGYDKGKRCNCDVDCGERGDCCRDYEEVCLPPTPESPCSGGARSANLPLSECLAMQQLYDATDGAHWHNCGANFRTDPCGCDMGVPYAACGGDGGGVCCRTKAGTPAAGQTHVTQIYLGASGLAGSLPTDLRALTHLKWLQLSC
eukprot:COSAG02_NODE_14633_length_1252_cov_1.608846_2_plen_377_part_01